MRYLFLMAILCFASIANAQLSPVKWAFDVSKTGDNEYNLIFTADVDKGWYIYSQYLESDDGPVRTTFTYENAASFEMIGKNEEKGTKKEIFDELFGMNVIKFCGKVKFVQKIKVKGDVSSIKGYVTSMTCDEEKCLPPKDVSFEILLPK